MAIPSSAKPSPLPAIPGNVPIVDPRTGLPTIDFLAQLQQVREYVNGTSRIIPCSASGTNLITLTPNDAAPLIERYNDFDGFAFVAAESSTGAVTATVVPKKGTLGALKVYVANGSAQAGNADITAGLFYIAFFVDSLDGGAGGFVLK